MTVYIQCTENPCRGGVDYLKLIQEVAVFHKPSCLVDKEHLVDEREIEISQGKNNSSLLVLNSRATKKGLVSKNNRFRCLLQQHWAKMSTVEGATVSECFPRSNNSTIVEDRRYLLLEKLHKLANTWAQCAMNKIFLRQTQCRDTVSSS